MTSQPSCACDLSDRDLLAELERAVSCERQAMARLIALLMEVDSRKLYAGQGCSSLFTYCVQVLHLSEHAAYLRIEAARSARRFPAILDRLADGSLHLTAVSLLGPHLTAANCDDLFCAATHQSKREVEQLVARVRPQPDVPAIVRKCPTPASPLISETPPSAETEAVAEEPVSSISSTSVVTVPLPARPATIKPLAPERYRVQFTMSHETYEKLRRVQDLMRHSNPTGDVAAIVDRALTLLLADSQRLKAAPLSGHGLIGPRVLTRATYRRRSNARCGGAIVDVARFRENTDAAPKPAFWSFITLFHMPTAVKQSPAISSCGVVPTINTKPISGQGIVLSHGREKDKRILACKSRTRSGPTS